MQISVEQITEPKEKEKYRIPEKEVIRYLGGYHMDISDEARALMTGCIDDVFNASGYRACYVRTSVKISETDVIDFGFFKTQSHGLAKNLAGCSEAVIFAATIGSGVDRLIKRAELVSPARSACYQAAGAADVENYCNDLNRRINSAMEREGFRAHLRYSPGYEDFRLENQKAIISELQCPTRIGITLTDRLMMMPSKSVTAVIGYEKTGGAADIS